MTTNAHGANHSPADHTRRPTAASAAAVTTAATVGQRKESRKFVNVDLRPAISGPTPVSTSMISPTGSIHFVKKGGPTVSRSPVIASLRVGNIVANSTKNAQNSRIQLFSRNAASRDIHESSS